MEKKLNLILQKLGTLENGQKEIYQIVSALQHRQDETDAKLDALSMDVHKLHGELSSVKEQTISNTEQYAPLSARMEDMETDMKILKKAFTS